MNSYNNELEKKKFPQRSSLQPHSSNKLKEDKSISNKSTSNNLIYNKHIPTTYKLNQANVTSKENILGKNYIEINKPEMEPKYIINNNNNRSNNNINNHNEKEKMIYLENQVASLTLVQYFIHFVEINRKRKSYKRER